MFEPKYIRKKTEDNKTTLEGTPEGNLTTSISSGEEKKKGPKIAVILKFLGTDEKSAEEECADFIKENKHIKLVTPSNSVEHMFETKLLKFTDKKKKDFKHFAKIELPNNCTKEMREVLEKYLALKSPESMRSLEEKREQKLKAAQAASLVSQAETKLSLRAKISAGWTDFTHNPKVVRAKSFLLENALSQYLVKKGHELFAWFKETSLGKKIQNGLTRLNQWQEKVLVKFKEVKSNLQQKLAVANEWLVFLAGHLKNYFQQLLKEPKQWSRGFFQAPSRYPGTLSLLITGTVVGFTYGMSAAIYGLLAGTGLFAATHLRNYLYEQRYRYLNSHTHDEESPALAPHELGQDLQEAVSLKENDAYCQGLAAGNDWTLWAKSCFDKKALKGWFDCGAGQYAANNESLSKKHGI